MPHTTDNRPEVLEFAEKAQQAVKGKVPEGANIYLVPAVSYPLPVFFPFEYRS